MQELGTSPSLTARLVAVLFLVAGVGCSSPEAPGTPDAADMPDGATTGNDSPGDARRVFVTGAVLGNLYESPAGLIGGDARCNRVATSSGLGGTWRAWLSAEGSNAIDRIEGDGPWYLTDGSTLVFASRAALAAGPAAKINRDELGGELADDLPVWTGTTSTGASLASTCSAWTAIAGSGHVGRIGSMTASWTDDGELGCGSYAYLYCFEQ